MANQIKLKGLLDKINWLFKSFEDNNFENISELEKALLKEKLLMLYNEIDNVSSKIPQERPLNVTSEKVVATNEIVKNEIIEEEKIEIIKEPVFEKEVIEEVLPKKIIVEKEEIIKPTIEVIQEVEKVEPVIEVVANNSETVKMEEAVQYKKEKFNKTEEFQRQIAMPKRDMREIIDLNKSFIFKAELFKQNNEKYNEFINEMNTTRTEEEAFSVMINWTEKLNWQTEENKAYDLLLKAIEKRFLPLI